MEKKAWQKRGFVSLLTFTSFIVMTVTGLILYITPQGRIAYWVEWHLIGLTKTQWGNIHTLSSILFRQETVTLRSYTRQSVMMRNESTLIK